MDHIRRGQISKSAPDVLVLSETPGAVSRWPSSRSSFRWPCSSWARPWTWGASSTLRSRSRTLPARVRSTDAVNPRCDTAGRTLCADPDTAEWRVRNEAVGLDALNVTFSCSSGGTPVSMTSCQAGDMYETSVSTTFNLVTPLLVPVLGNNLNLDASATASCSTTPSIQAPLLSRRPRSRLCARCRTWSAQTSRSPRIPGQRPAS